ncbi:hypothetical protein DFH07DRAFT_783024 [Mycena maculata]|uniref:Uncharacterized protein n=1 Tax=Mycena maculata TaxID=230809 RepID=A0AAD7MNS6_9AGAR|nr:hypothetical protein DFH07DRAFT_783024 [Mycena maculata]
MAQNNFATDIITPQSFYAPSASPKKKKKKKPGKRSPPQPAIATVATPSQQPISAPSTQPRLRQPKQTEWQKMDSILGTITKDFRSLGNFLQVLFYNRISGVSDPRTPCHVRVVSAFLGGESIVAMATIINLIYNHRQSRAPKDSLQYSMEFSPPDIASPWDIDYARQSLSTCALQTVGAELRRQIGGLTQNDPSDPFDITQLRASTNGRAKNVRLATWDTFGKLSILLIGATYKRRARAVWYTTECIWSAYCEWHNCGQKEAASHCSRCDQLVNPVPQPFACQTHVSEKHIFSCFGFTVHDTTVRACLGALTDSSMAKLRASVAEGIKRGTMYWQIVLDNVQQYCRQRDHRLGRQDVLKVGTAATAILLEDCAPGAFNLQDHVDRVMKQERRQLTIDSLYAAIDWAYIHELTALHWVRILVYFIPQLAYLRPAVNAAFESE